VRHLIFGDESRQRLPGISPTPNNGNRFAKSGDRGFEPISLQRGVRNEPVPQRPQNYGAKRFTSDKQNWGYQLRFGLFEISDVDMTRLTAM